MTATTKLCSRSGTFPTKNERELTTVYFSPAKQVNHCYCKKCGQRVLLLMDGTFATHVAGQRTTTQGRAVITTPGGRQRVDIPITRNAHLRTDSATTPPLWAGPVRRHR
jgi:hypothetical protein